jgi:hypothetical protein
LRESDPDAITLTCVPSHLGPWHGGLQSQIGVSRALDNKDRIDMSNDGITNYYAYLGLGRSFATDCSFSPRRRDFSSNIRLARGGNGGPCLERESQAIMNVTQIKDAIRYMSRTDRIEISRWLDGELAGGLPFRSDRVDGLQRSVGTERTLMVDGKASGPTITQRR